MSILEVMGLKTMSQMLARTLVIGHGHGHFQTGNFKISLTV